MLSRLTKADVMTTFSTPDVIMMSCFAFKTFRRKNNNAFDVLLKTCISVSAIQNSYRYQPLHLGKERGLKS